MKKIALIAALALLCVCCLAAAGCGKTEVATNSDPASQTSSEAENKSDAPANSAETSNDNSEATGESSDAADESNTDSTDSTDVPGSGFDPSAYEGGVFWLTGFGDNSQEGGGVIFTDTDNGGLWWLHVAFAPKTVDGVTFYEVTDLVNGISDGSASALSVPEGGFVYTLHPGNNYPKLAAEDPNNTYLQGKPNYVTDACTDIIKKASTWKVGDVIYIEGLDLTSTEVPTETPDLQYYEEGYICPLTYVYVGQ